MPMHKSDLLMHKSDLLYGILVYVMVASSEMRGNLWFPERI